MTMTLAALVAQSRNTLSDAGLADPATDARALVCGLLGFSTTDLVLSADRPISDEEQQTVQQALSRRLAREPVHRILGEREFYGVRLMLSPHTLEPRPDTEVLVDAILPFARQCVVADGPAQLLDLGTGTGAIAIALLKEVPQLSAVGADIASGARDMAVRNAALNGVAERFTGVESRWFDAITGRFDIIVSNPPYIRSDVIRDLEPDVRNHDPILALDGGSDGLDAYHAIARNAHAYLKEGGMIGLEIGYDQKQPVTELFAARGYTLIKAVRDYGGNDRVLLFTSQKA
ncbi:peptide chain release factor N(5)-glutamine methyltransferase [Rhizobium sp. FY34]|uniref:peptide chain release factor N(5)-glutamine methyltransferase n=1 Tax=Rhizobium sp. FY34 TaxID=2562309 RepID=UPI0014856D79|nr:peptide chain release factor N(5)-glutamine methyltransferase [Rhizobium sp. FY34]